MNTLTMLILSRHTPLLALLLLALLGFAACTNANSEQQQRLLEKRLAQAEDSTYQSTLRPFYANRSYRLVWAGPEGLTRQARMLLGQLCDTSKTNPLSVAFDPGTLEQAIRDTYQDVSDNDSLRAERLVGLELYIAHTLLGYADQLANGTVSPEAVDQQWHLRKPQHDLRAFLQAAAEEDLDAARQTLPALQSRRATALRDALGRYEAIAEAGGWPTIAGKETMKKGDTSDRVAALRRRLAVTGDLADTTAATTFDEAVEAAVQRFQKRHGLPEDGEVNEATLDALNVPVADRLRQMRVNLERLRWLPEDYGTDYVYVNIPDFHLYAYRERQQTLDMAVIAGEVLNQTPVFADTMTHVIFRPYWNVPSSIAEAEILPKLQTDSGYLARNRYEVVDNNGHVVPASTVSADALENYQVRIRQQPGPGNALGNVKFMFPNDYNTYLHDTPADHLFSQAERDFSHGCVRLERPAAMAGFVLQEQQGDWSQDRITSLMKEGEMDRRVDLDHPLPVYIVYLTAWVDADDQVQFRDDVYRRDAALSEELQQHRTQAEVRCASLHQHLAERE